jgi:hypothetical protein
MSTIEATTPRCPHYSIAVMVGISKGLELLSNLVRSTVQMGWKWGLALFSLLSGRLIEPFFFLFVLPRSPSNIER